MEKAKAAVSEFLHKDGKHDTTVHERVNPAIQNEHITPTHHEEHTRVVDREVHQDHHHTTVQPIKHQEVLPEQHSHNLKEVEHREFHHGNGEHLKEKLATEAAQFKNTRDVGETQHTSSQAPVVGGEHVHHHVHETIQPVIQKETIQPSVVHTTVPVHEVHHNEAKHHTASALPAVTMDEFQRQGGALGGRDVRTDAFAGEPRSVSNALGGKNHGVIGGHGAQGTTSLTDGDSKHDQRRVGTNGTDSVPGSTGHTAGTTSSTAPGISTGGTTGTSGTGEMKKASLMDKLNPKVDSNGDGKAGFLK